VASLSKLSPKTISRFKNEILGRDFDLSLAYVTRNTMHALNKAQRGIDAPTDILSFPLSKTSGEMVLCMPEVVSHAKVWDVPAKDYLPYLVIHGLVHLKGHDHGRIMTRLEHEYCSRLSVRHPLPVATKNGTTNRSGHRRGHVPSTRRRIAPR
jgi:rRNA maturation RNase YbeY